MNSYRKSSIYCRILLTLLAVIHVSLINGTSMKEGSHNNWNLATVLSSMDAGDHNRTFYFPAVISSIGKNLPTTGLSGILHDIGMDGCSLIPLQEAVLQVKALSWYESNSHPNLIALIPRGNCSFEKKIKNAQKSGAQAVIVYDSPLGITDKPKDINSSMNINFEESLYQTQPNDYASYRNLIKMISDNNGLTESVSIVSLFVSADTGRFIKQAIKSLDNMEKLLEAFLYALDDSQVKNLKRSSRHRVIEEYALILGSEFILAGITTLMLFSLAGLLSIIVVLFLRFMRYRSYQKKLQRQRLSQNDIRKIKCYTFKHHGNQEDNEQICAICLEHLSAGDIVRELACAHRFHSECVDGWLTKKLRSCPTCRQDALIATPVMVNEKNNSSTTKSKPTTSTRITPSINISNASDHNISNINN